MSSYGGYNVGVAFALADYFEAKTRAIRKGEEDKEGSCVLLDVEGEVA